MADRLSRQRIVVQATSNLERSTFNDWEVRGASGARRGGGLGDQAREGERVTGSVMS
jgi:hypothetical protein